MLELLKPEHLFSGKTLRHLVTDNHGFVVSIELVLMASIAMIGLVVGMSSVRDAVISEISDMSGAVQDLNQSYSISGIDGHSAQSHGSDFIDATDWCDNADDAAGAIDNCIVFVVPSNEIGDDGGGDDGGGDDGGGDDGGGDDGGGDDFGTPADGDLVSDNFQDGNGNAPFNLQVRNTTNTATGWTAVLDSVPYATIPGLAPGNYTLTTTMNPDGSFTHVFSGTMDLEPFQNITITGGLPTPPGMGGTSNVDLFLN